MNFQFGHIHIIYLGLIVVSVLVGYSGFFILKKNLKFRKSDPMGIYSSILAILVAVIVLIYSLLHVFAHT